MKYKEKSKVQLIREINDLKKQITDFKKLKDGSKKTESVLNEAEVEALHLITQLCIKECKLLCCFDALCYNL